MRQISFKNISLKDISSKDISFKDISFKDISFKDRELKGHKYRQANLLMHFFKSQFRPELEVFFVNCQLVCKKNKCPLSSLNEYAGWLTLWII